MMNAKTILIKALSEMGADGLCNPVGECGCSIEDFAPCWDCNLDECMPARMIKLDGRFYPIS